MATKKDPREFWQGLTAVCEMAKFYMLHQKVHVEGSWPEALLPPKVPITPPRVLDNSQIYLAVTERENEYLVTFNKDVPGRISWGNSADIWVEEALHNLMSAKNLYRISRRRGVSKNSLYRARDSGIMPHWLAFYLLERSPTFLTDDGETLEDAYRRIQPLMAHLGAKKDPLVCMWTTQ